MGRPAFPVSSSRRRGGPGQILTTIYGRIDGQDYILRSCTLAERDEAYDEILRTMPEVEAAWSSERAPVRMLTEYRRVDGRSEYRSAGRSMRRPTLDDYDGPEAA
jgi:hypothetical protein